MTTRGSLSTSHLLQAKLSILIRIIPYSMSILGMTISSYTSGIIDTAMVKSVTECQAFEFHLSRINYTKSVQDLN